MVSQLRNRSFDDAEPVILSICCITFNHRAFIEQSLEGFLDQECDFRIEIFIHDDASTDGTGQIIQDYADRYPSIFRFIQQSENQWTKGVNPYYSYLFPKARGKYIAICDGDDYWDDPKKLATQVAYLDANPQTVIVYGPTRAIDENGEIEGYIGGAQRDLSAEELKAAHPINTLTTCFRNLFQSKPPPKYLRNSPIGDLTVWGYLGQYGNGVYLKDLKPAIYRLHSGGVMSLLPRENQFLMTALAQLNLAAFHAEARDEAAARRSLSIAVKMMNKTRYIKAIPIGAKGASLIHALKLWFKSRRRKTAR